MNVVLKKKRNLLSSEVFTDAPSVGDAAESDLVRGAFLL